MGNVELLRWATDLLSSAWTRYTKNRAEQPGKDLVKRFVRVFEAQDVKRIEIPRVLAPDWKLKAAQVLDDGKLLDLLDELLLEHVCSQFGVT